MWTDEELTDAQVLAHRMFAPPTARGAPERAGGAHGWVRRGHPLLHPGTPEDLPNPLRGLLPSPLPSPLPSGPGPGRSVGAMFAVDLDPLHGDRLHTGAWFEVALSGAEARAVQVARDADEWGLARTGEATGPASALAARAATAAEKQLGLLRRLAARRNAPRGWATVALPSSGAAVRLCLAADVVGYSGRGNAEAAVLQRDLVDVLGRARRAAGIRDADVDPQKQGDGQFIVLPVGIDESVVIPALLAELGERLLERDRGRPAEQRMRLRVALHRGLVEEGANGWIGTAAVAVHRILDSDPLRDAVRQNPAAAYVLGVPDVLYRDVIVHAVRPPLPADFREMTVELPAKNFIERGWLHLGPEVTS